MTVSQKGSVPVEEPYYPTWLDKIKCKLGLHYWIDRTDEFNIAYRKIEICLICHKHKIK